MTSITKKTKTVLFASLIAAMILPFSGMQFAEAEEQTPEIKQLNTQIKELKAKDSLTQEEREDLKQLKLLKKWFKAEHNNNTERMDRIAERINKNFPTEGLTKAVTIDSSELTIQGYHLPVVSFEGSIEKNFNCHDNSDDLGSISGTLYGYSNSLYSVVSMDYTYSVTTGSGLNCTDNNWDYSEVSLIEVLNPTANCEIDTFSSATDTEAKNCTALSAGSWVLIQGQSYYDNNIYFSPWTSYSYEYIE